MNNSKLTFLYGVTLDKASLIKAIFFSLLCLSRDLLINGPATHA